MCTSSSHGGVFGGSASGVVAEDGLGRDRGGLQAVTRKMDEFFLVIEMDAEAREEAFLPKEAERHVVPLMGIVNLDG